MLSLLPTEVLDYIKQFLTYKERIEYLSICSLTKSLQLQRFYPYDIQCIQWPHRSDPSYLLVYHPFDIPYYSHPHTFLGHSFVSIVIYDTLYSYYHIRIMKPYHPDKSINDYLSEYQRGLYYMNRILKYTD